MNNEDAWLQMGNEMSLALKDDNNMKRKTQEKKAKKGEKGGAKGLAVCKSVVRLCESV